MSQHSGRVETGGGGGGTEGRDRQEGQRRAQRRETEGKDRGEGQRGGEKRDRAEG